MSGQLKYYGNLLLGQNIPESIICIPASKFDKENTRQGRFPGHYYYCNIKDMGEYIIPIVDIEKRPPNSFVQLKEEATMLSITDISTFNLKGGIIRSIGHSVDLEIIDEITRGVILIKDPNNIEDGRKLMIQVKIIQIDDEARIALLLGLRLKESELGSDIPKTNKRFELLWNLVNRVFPENEIVINFGGNTLVFQIPDAPSWLELVSQ